MKGVISDQLSVEKKLYNSVIIAIISGTDSPQLEESSVYVMGGQKLEVLSVNSASV